MSSCFSRHFRYISKFVMYLILYWHQKTIITSISWDTYNRIWGSKNLRGQLLRAVGSKPCRGKRSPFQHCSKIIDANFFKQNYFVLITFTKLLREVLMPDKTLKKDIEMYLMGEPSSILINLWLQYVRLESARSILIFFFKLSLSRKSKYYLGWNDRIYCTNVGRHCIK